MKDPKKLITLKKKEMNEAVRELDFETAAILRDEIRALEAGLPETNEGKKSRSML